MSVHACFGVALRALAKNRLRSGLTMLGLIIGVATVLTMFSLGTGAQAAIENQVRAAGMNIVTVASGNHMGTVEDDTQAGNVDGDARDEQALEESLASAEAPVSAQPASAPQATASSQVSAEERNAATEKLGAPATLALSDAQAIRAIPGVQFVSEGVHSTVRIGAGDTQFLASVHGDDSSLQSIRRAWKFDAGRFYTAQEQAQAAQVMVLGSVLAERMFGKENPVGKTVTLWDRPFRIVGVANTSSWIVAASKGDDQFDAAYVPFTTVHKLLGLSALSNITLTVANAGDLTRITKAVSALLRQRHGLADPSRRDDFTVTSQARKAIATGGLRREMAKALTGNMDLLDRVTLEQMNKTLQRASRTMTALLASVAAVSLLVGGIGIMNTMLLSVTERTREIGLRRAIGARSSDVLRQFLMEAAVISVSGGLAGVLLGIAASIAITRWAGWSTSVSAAAVLLAFCSAASVGIFFGYYPARQASEVAPMESLRYE